MSQQLFKTSNFQFRTKTILLNHSISKSLPANVGRHKIELCTRRFEKQLDFRPTFCFFHKGLFLLTSCRKISQISIQAHTKKTQKNFNSKSSPLKLTRLRWSTDFVLKLKKTIFQTFVLPFCKYNLSGNMFDSTTPKTKTTLYTNLPNVSN